MKKLPSAFSTLAISGLLAVAGVATSAGGASAHGAADQPLAQIELSENCNNPDYPADALPSVQPSRT